MQVRAFERYIPLTVVGQVGNGLFLTLTPCQGIEIDKLKLSQVPVCTGKQTFYA